MDLAEDSTEEPAADMTDSIMSDRSDNLAPTTDTLVAYAAPGPIVADDVDSVDDSSPPKSALPAPPADTKTESPSRAPVAALSGYDVFLMKENGHIPIQTAPNVVEIFSPKTEKETKPAKPQPALDTPAVGKRQAEKEIKPVRFAEPKAALDTPAVGKRQTRSMAKLLEAAVAAQVEATVRPSRSKPVVDTPTVGKTQTRSQTKRLKEAAALTVAGTSNPKPAVDTPAEGKTQKNTHGKKAKATEACANDIAIYPQDIPLPASPTITKANKPPSSKSQYFANTAASEREDNKAQNITGAVK